MLRNSPARYGSVSKTFHWVMAALVVFMLCLGLYMDGVAALAEKLRLYNLHKSLGATVLFLALCRLAWHLYSAKPPLLASLKPLEKTAARTVHALMYVFMIGMPLSGWLMSSAAGRAVGVFGFFTLPDLVGQDEALAGLMRSIHGIAAYGFMAAICLHVAGAVKHHFIDRDATLRRMLPFTEVS
jgi:cytochrome b561